MAFTASDCFHIKYSQMVMKAGKEVLTYTLQCGTSDKNPTDTLNEYLINLPSNSTAYMKFQRNRRKLFTKTDREIISKDPSYNTFDITLLYKTIQTACENVADGDTWNTGPDGLEHWIWQIKDIRNKIAHEQLTMSESDFLTKSKELKELLVKVLEATKQRYDRGEAEFEEKKTKVLEVVKDIEEDRLCVEEMMNTSTSELLSNFKAESNSELEENFRNAKYLDPLQFLSGYKGNRVDVQDVFSSIEIIEEKGIAPGEKDSGQVDYLNLLQVTQDNGERPQILLIEGDAGSGKTTLVTFLLSEWLKEECDRRIKGLDQYDLLLRVVCREKNRSTLNDMLKRFMPGAYMKYGSRLVPLLKRCRVLILVDGLDERNEDSRQLLEDILSEGYAFPNLTVVCTSRPEAVEGFKDTTPDNFQTSHVILVGLPLKERTNVVVQHYEWLCNTEPRDTSIASVTKVMEQLTTMEIFRLPLNLLFLAKMFHHDPESVNSTITQSRLYQFIHKWCIEKLCKSLSSCFEPKETKKKLDPVLKEIYRVALQGLPVNSIFLTKEDEESLDSSCKNAGLPINKVIPAFYSMRREVIDCVTEECYCIPHRGLQDFFAAKYIFGQLQEYKGDVTRILDNSKIDMELHSGPLRNMFCHLLELLVQEENPLLTAMKETVDFIRRSGVTHIDQWLKLLADTLPAKIHPTVLTRIKDHILTLPESEKIHINDGTVHAATVMLTLIPPREVSIKLSKKLASLHALADALNRHIITELSLLHHYEYPDESNTSDTILQQFPKMPELAVFSGHLNAEHLKLIPQKLHEDLELSLRGNDHARNLLPALSEAKKSFPKIKKLKIHIPVSAVSPDTILHPLPDDPKVWLDLSGVGEKEIEVACRIIKNLCPIKKGYMCITFHRSALTPTKWKGFLKLLADDGVKVRQKGIYIPDTADITNNDVSELDDLAVDIGLGCLRTCKCLSRVLDAE